jgi:ketosteroid isomerase-like protein
VASVTLLLNTRSLFAKVAATQSDEDIIWHNEQAIYAGRAVGDLSFYVNHTDPDYAVWPPMVKTPMNRDELAASAKRAAGQGGEVLTLEKNQIRIHRNGNIALAYYTTHRTRRAGGGAVDESFENIHVWVKDPEGWRVFGGMSRPVPQNRESLSGPLPTAK